MTQAESTPPVTPPPVIFASDSFATFSRAIKDGYSLVFTLSSIPTSATRGPNADLSHDEGSEEVIEYFDDEPIMKTHVSDFDEASNDEHTDTRFCTHNLILEGS